MNDGVAAFLVQWCLLLFIWMGSADRPLARIGLSRGQALVFLALSLVCSALSWEAALVPADVNPGGTVLPLLLAGWLWTHLPDRCKPHAAAAAFLFTTLIFCYRKLLFWDPVLLVLDEKQLIPLLALVTVNLLTRDWRQQCLIALVGLPLADVLWQFSVLSQAGRIQLGDEAAQDLLWGTVGVWAVSAVIWHGVKKGAVSAYRSLAVNVRGRMPTKPDR